MIAPIGSLITAAGSPGLGGGSGPEGPRGPVGGDGKSFIWMGDWDENSIYPPGSVVRREGSVYVSVVENIDIDPTVDDGTYWQLMTEGGIDGLPGDQGDPGLNAFNVVSGPFTIPPVGSSVIVTLEDASWVVPGQYVYVGDASGPGEAGLMIVTAKTGNQLALMTPAQPSDAIPLADGYRNGLLRQLSGSPDDFVDGTNNCQLLPRGCYFGSDLTNTNNYEITVDSSFKLEIGVTVFATITNMNNADRPTLNVNGTGARNIRNRWGIEPFAFELRPGHFIGLTFGGTNWRLFTPIARFYNAQNVNGAVTIECAGYDFVSVSIHGASGNGVTLSRLSRGVPVTFHRVTGATSSNWWLEMTNEAGTAIPTYWCWANALSGVAVVRCDSTSFQAQNASSHLLIQGMYSGQNYLLMK